MIRKFLNKFDIKSRTVLIMGLFISVVLVVFLVFFSRVYYRYEENLFGQESLNTLHTLDTSIQSFIQNADNYSKMLISDNTVQEQMATGDLTSDMAGQQKVIQKVYSILQFSQSAEEIWFIDNSGKTLKVGEYPSSSDNKKLEDYEELRQPYGRAQVIVVTDNKNGNLSLVRSYNSTTDFSSIGIIGVEISRDRFINMISQTVDVSREKLLIIDENQNIIYWSDNQEDPDTYINIASNAKYKEGDILEVVKFGHRKLLMSGIEGIQTGWKIIRFTQLPIELSSKGLLRLNMAIVVLIGIIMMISSSVMARILSQPTQTMLDAMSTAKDGVPQKIYEKSSLREFEMLYEGHNSMVDRISQLIDETIERQKRIRQVELNEIQEQMKPHFLYNTLESVEALAMIGDSERVCKLIEALGDFYRKSVSGGKEFLTIEEELRIAKDYIQIMEIRFGDSFNTEIDCDSKCLGYMIPKLTIQPLVENAFQYGVRARNNHGDIYVMVSYENDTIHILVEDSGDGVPDDIIEEIMGDRELAKGKSLGLRGTVERLRLLYGESFRYQISKKPSKIELFIKIGDL